jgi:hypothetical protein
MIYNTSWFNHFRSPRAQCVSCFKLLVGKPFSCPRCQLPACSAICARQPTNTNTVQYPWSQSDFDAIIIRNYKPSGTNILRMNSAKHFSRVGTVSGIKTMFLACYCIDALVYQSDLRRERKTQLLNVQTRKKFKKN